MLPTAANLVKFGRKSQPFAKAGSPVFICRTRKRQGRFRSRSKNIRNGFDGLSRCDARRWRATEIPTFSVENVSKLLRIAKAAHKGQSCSHSWRLICLRETFDGEGCAAGCGQEGFEGDARAG